MGRMSLTGLWINSHNYKVTDSETGRSEVVIIGATREEIADPVNVLELEHMARESVQSGWTKEKPKQVMTKDQQHGLGETLNEITESKRNHRETGHSKYWRSGK